MTAHLVSAAVAVALSIGAVATPASAQNARTFDAWGHTFDLRTAQPGEAVRVAPRPYDVLSTGSVARSRWSHIHPQTKAD